MVFWNSDIVMVYNRVAKDGTPYIELKGKKVDIEPLMGRKNLISMLELFFNRYKTSIMGKYKQEKR